MVLFSGIIALNSGNAIKARKTFLLPCFLRLTTNYPEASQIDNLTKISHRSKDMICSNTADYKDTPSSQHLFVCLLQTSSFFVGILYVGRCFLHIRPHHAQDPGKDQVSNMNESSPDGVYSS